MQHDHLTDDELVDLSLRLLAPEEVQRSLEHAEACSACANRLQQHLGDVESLRGRRPSAGQTTSGARHRPRRMRWMVSGGALAAAAIVLLMLVPRGPDHLWLDVSPELITRSTEASAPAALRAGLERYADRDAPGTIELLQGLELSPELARVRDCYLGSALQQAGRAREAAEVLTPLVQEGLLPQPWRKQVADMLADLQRTLAE